MAITISVPLPHLVPWVVGWVNRDAPPIIVFVSTYKTINWWDVVLLSDSLEPVPFWLKSARTSLAIFPARHPLIGGPAHSELKIAYKTCSGS